MTGYIYGAIGAVVLGLLATIGFYQFVRVPHLQSEVTQAQASEKAAEAQSAVAESDRAALQTQLDNANSRLQAFAGQCREADAAARLAAQQAADKAMPLPVSNNAKDINAWLQGLASQ